MAVKHFLLSLRSLEWSGLVQTLVGAFVGAYCAFGLERCSRAEIAEDENVAAGVVALLKLELMERDVRQLYCFTIKKFEHNSDGWFSAGHILLPTRPVEAIDISPLLFVIRDRQANTLSLVKSAETRYLNFISNNHVRHDLFATKIEPTIGDRSALPLQETESLITKVYGQGVVATLKVTWADLIRYREVHKQLDDARIQLRSDIKHSLPDTGEQVPDAFINRIEAVDDCDFEASPATVTVGG